MEIIHALVVSLCSLLLRLGLAKTAWNGELQLVQLQEGSGAKCNDGTPPAYWIERGDHSIFLLWLDGLGDCTNQEECDKRAKRLMSTKDATLSSTLSQRSGIFSRNLSANPFFHSATKVIVHYCSSDSWLGNVELPIFGGRYFQGQRILNAVVRHLEEREGLPGADMLIIGGAAAGGRGVLYNIDHICSTLLNPGTVCRGFADASWWVQPATGTDLATGAREGFAAWNASKALLPCLMSVDAGSGHMCLFGSILAPHVRTSVFFNEDLYDSSQLASNGVNGPVSQWSPDQMDVARRFRDKIVSTLQQLPSKHAAFAASCHLHASSPYDSFWRVQLSSTGASLERSLTEWLQHTQGPYGGFFSQRLQLESCKDAFCSKKCGLSGQLGDGSNSSLLISAIGCCAAVVLCVWLCCRYAAKLAPRTFAQIKNDERSFANSVLE